MQQHNVPEKVFVIEVASAFRVTLDRSDVLVAFGERSNAALNALDGLVAKHIITGIAETGAVRARHHVIAELVRDELVKRGSLGPVLMGLILAMVAKATPAMSRNAAPRRFLRRLLDHRFLVRAVSVEGARNLYGEFEQLLSWDYHYWLQRGSLEVKFGDLRLAANFLSQARGLKSGDPLIETEYAYLIFRQAIDTPGAVWAPGATEQATEILEDLIVRRGRRDPYPYHVLGSQGLSWARRGIGAVDERAEYLRRLLAVLEDGCVSHPSAADLRKLRVDIQKELWSIAVRE